MHYLQGQWTAASAAGKKIYLFFMSKSPGVFLKKHLFLSHLPNKAECDLLEPKQNNCRTRSKGHFYSQQHNGHTKLFTARLKCMLKEVPGKEKTEKYSLCAAGEQANARRWSLTKMVRFQEDTRLQKANLVIDPLLLYAVQQEGCPTW